MLQSINRIDPLKQYRLLTANFCIVFLFSLGMFFYLQPPNALFSILAALLCTFAGSFSDSIGIKFLFKLVCLVFFSLSIVLFTVLKSMPGVLMIASFTMMFIFLTLAYYGAYYRTLACLAVLFSVSALFVNKTWIDALDAIINVTVVFIVSALVDLLFVPFASKKLHWAYIQVSRLFEQRLLLCRTMVVEDKPISEALLQRLLDEDMHIRNQIYQMSLLNKELSLDERKSIEEYQLSIIHARQSIYAVIDALRDAMILKSELPSSILDDIDNALSKVHLWRLGLRGVHRENHPVLTRVKPLTQLPTGPSRSLILAMHALTYDLNHMLALYNEELKIENRAMV